MNDHKQEKITVEFGETIEVDEGLGEIIENFYIWGIPTVMSCIDNNGSVWIQIGNGFFCQKFLEFTLYTKKVINSVFSEKETLWDFLQKHAEIKKDSTTPPEFIDLSNENNIFELGMCREEFSIRFPKELFETFKKLFFEAFPPAGKEYFVIIRKFTIPNRLLE